MRFVLISLCATILALAGCAPKKSEHADAGSNPRAAHEQGDYVLVDKSDRKLTVYRGQVVLREFNDLQFGAVPDGHKRFEGDERTPEGRYAIDWRNPQSAYHLSLRVSYPNENDRAYARQFGRSPGGDIFIHGQPNAMKIGRMMGDWTDGCIALSNAQIAELWHLVPDGTTIVIQP